MCFFQAIFVTDWDVLWNSSPLNAPAFGSTDFWGTNFPPHHGRNRKSKEIRSYDQGVWKPITRWWHLKDFVCSPLFGEDFHVDEHIFQRGWELNHQLAISFSLFFFCRRTLSALNFRILGESIVANHRGISDHPGTTKGSPSIRVFWAARNVSGIDTLR